MSVLEALVLGIVQGLTEFIPISSKTHLTIIPALLFPDSHLSASELIPFEVMLHAGTLVAALIYFRHDLFEALEGLDRRGASRRFIGLMALGAIPAGLIGATFESRLQLLYDRPALGAALLVVTGVILVATETFFRRHHRDESIEETAFSNVEKIASEVTPGKALFIGLAQILALSPGVSRAGTTIGAGLLAGLSRPQAARFSFMISIPLIAGAAIAEIPKISLATIGAAPIIVGFLASLIAGYVAIAGMIGYLQRRGLYPFAAYCFVVGPLVWFILSR